MSVYLGYAGERTLLKRNYWQLCICVLRLCRGENTVKETTEIPFKVLNSNVYNNGLFKMIITKLLTLILSSSWMSYINNITYN